MIVKILPYAEGEMYTFVYGRRGYHQPQRSSLSLSLPLSLSFLFPAFM